MDTLNETLLRSSLNYSTEEPKFNKDRNETVEKRLFNGNKYSKLQSVDTSSDDNEEQRIGSNGAEDQAVSQSVSNERIPKKDWKIFISFFIFIFFFFTTQRQPHISITIVNTTTTATINLNFSVLFLQN